ncbi:MAG: acylphosphatase [bacterium]|nr:acylphosphatase [bacterium]
MTQTFEQFTALIHGRVQGVGYRFFAERVANQLGITGYAKNLWNGDVEVVAQAEKAVLETFLAKLREGPRLSKVTEIEVEWQPVSKLYPNFDIQF